MRAILPLAAVLVGLAACDSPTAPSLNPQPLPPGLHRATSDLNPQPLPPGRHFSATTGFAPVRPGQATIQACGVVRTGTYEPPDPCFHATSSLNPQPLPPGLHFSSTPGSVPGKPGATMQACRAVRAYQPPDPCLQ